MRAHIRKIIEKLESDNKEINSKLISEFILENEIIIENKIEEMWQEFLLRKNESKESNTNKEAIVKILTFGKAK